MGLGVASDLPEALAQAFAITGHGAKVAVIPDGVSAIPTKSAVSAAGD
jgi:nickel-dependent lactate racemase